MCVQAEAGTQSFRQLQIRQQQTLWFAVLAREGFKSRTPPDEQLPVLSAPLLSPAPLLADGRRSCLLLILLWWMATSLSATPGVLSRSACSLHKISWAAASLIYSHWLCLLSAQAHTSTTLTFIKTDPLQNIKLLHKSAVYRFYLILLKHFMVLYHHRVEDGRTAAGTVKGCNGIWYLACYSNDPQPMLALLRLIRLNKKVQT